MMTWHDQLLSALNKRYIQLGQPCHEMWDNTEKPACPSTILQNPKCGSI